MKAPESRLSNLLNLLEESGENSFLFFAIAKEYEGLGQSEKALEYYLKIEKSEPDYVGLYYHLGKLHEQRDEPESALRVYRKGLEISENAGDQKTYEEISFAISQIEEN